MTSNPSKEKPSSPERLSREIKRDMKAVDELCRKGSPESSAENYIVFCLSSDPKRLPNMAGFFRWLKLSAAALDHFRQAHSEKFRTVKMFFEDEAINSDLPPSIVSAYMKQLLSSENGTDEPKEESEGNITLVFEHDIEHDGE